ncbi:collectin-12-like [Branchiostoma floridae]|uniref:Collectin-12-like n=1 Tax=Branchiostoma floridae TaxID=7739 RepID=A0A9J7L947_BRAFL|nr:collectin-12-like [Branchiostoma floridae]
MAAADEKITPGGEDKPGEDVDISKLSSGRLCPVSDEHTRAPKRREKREKIRAELPSTPGKGNENDSNLRSKAVYETKLGPPGADSAPHPGPPEPRYLQIGDHIVECPEHREKSVYDKPEDVRGYKEEGNDYDTPEKSFAYKAKAKSCRRGWSGYKGHCYKLMTDKKSWKNAKKKCKRHGAKLASITSREEANFINSIIAGAPSGYWKTPLVWFGLRREDGKFRKFTDGSKVIYTNWEPGEPNNNRGVLSFFPAQNCVGMYSKDGVADWFHPDDEVKRGQWNDHQCIRLLPFICKRPK